MDAQSESPVDSGMSEYGLHDDVRHGPWPPNVGEHVAIHSESTFQYSFKVISIN